jgi:MFS transporter, DHA3 family, macrolide efflux protein
MELSSVFARRLNGTPAFLAVAVSQLFSILASTIVSFALGVWAYEIGGAVLPISIIAICQLTTNLAFGPIAGVIIDRYNRKYVMAFADVLAMTGTVFLFAMHVAGTLQLWHLYVHALIIGSSWAFQMPAYSATIGTLVKKSDLSRANAIVGMVDYTPMILAPVCAGLLYPMLGLSGLFALDMGTFAIAILTMLMVHIPDTPSSKEGTANAGNLKREMRLGLAYILRHPSLRSLLVLGLGTDVFIGVIYTIIQTIVLARTGNDETVLGLVWAAGGLGVVAASLFLAVRSNFKSLINISLLMQLGWGFALLVYGLARSTPVWALSIFAAYFCGQVSLITGKSIWQAKVPADIQGRVFSMRRSIMLLSSPLTPLLAATLADSWLEPLFKTSALAPAALTALVGSGPGAGMGAIMLFSGLGVIAFACLGWAMPTVRNVETLLPDKK